MRLTLVTAALSAAAYAAAAAPKLQIKAHASLGYADVAVESLGGRGALILRGTEILLNCRETASNKTALLECSTRVSLAARSQDLHFYVIDKVPGSVVTLFGEVTLPAAEPGATLPFASASETGSLLPPVGILYEVWHGFTATTYGNISQQGGTPLSVEDVLRAPNGTYSLFDVLDKYGARSAADNFFYQEQPVGGYYCLYRHRDGEEGLIPDCDGISATAARHAAELTSLGVSYVAVDATNLGTPSREAEVIQVRPAEVLFEEWAALRRAGVTTPAITAWQRAEAGATLWQGWLDLYNNASYDGLTARAPPNAPGGAGGKKIFFVPSGADAGIVANITSNGGRNDVVVVPMWANDHKGGQGEWAFMAPCTNGSSVNAGAAATYTTSVIGQGRGASACYQQIALGSPLGSSLSFSPSYQLMYGSVPFSSANKYDGLTFKRQWATLWEVVGAALDSAAAVSASPSSTESAPGEGAAQALTGALPDNLFLSSYNEWTSQPQPNRYPQPWAISMGMWGDNESSSLFVDTYGTSLSRDIEPSAREGGDAIFNILASCLRVAAVVSAGVAEVAADLRGSSRSDGAFAGLGAAGLRTVVGAGAGPSGLSSCAVAGEACCAYNETSDGYVPVWSFAAANGSDFMAAVDPEEPGTGYAEVCTGYPGNTDFCYNPSVLGSIAAWRGPFVLHSGGCGIVSAGVPSGVPVTPSLTLPGRVPLFRCVLPTGAHFLASDAACSGAANSAAVPLGCAHAYRSSNMARPLRACVDQAQLHYHITDGVCADGDVDRGVLGYVR